jgi:hypothetical protein
MPRRLLLLLLVPLCASLLWLARRDAAAPAGFPTPASCLDAYHGARRAGDVATYLRCLGEPLLSEERRVTADVLAERLRREARPVKGWAQAGEELNGDTAAVMIDEVRTTGTSRVRYVLKRDRAGWRIVAVDAGPERPAAVPYGTHIKDVGPGD